MTEAVKNHILLVIGVLLAYAIFRRYLRWLLYIGLGFTAVTSLPYVMRGQAPPWAASAVPWFPQLAQRALGIVQSPPHF